MITKLCEMAELYHTDKAGWYTPFYSLLFEHRRMEIRRVLEVGIGTKEAMAHVPGYMPGASLFMWQDYFPRAEIWGVDSDPRAQREDICCVLSDSRDPMLRHQVGSGYDIIIDDGAHDLDTQWETFLNLFPLVKDGGLYIIEDAADYQNLSAYLEGYSHQIVLCPSGKFSGKLILIQK
jgi:hypothetical protein